jgi:hypothetical protein
MLRRCQVGLLHKKPLEWAGAMPTPFWRPSFEFRLECDGSLWLSRLSPELAPVGFLRLPVAILASTGRRQSRPKDSIGVRRKLASSLQVERQPILISVRPSASLRVVTCGLAVAATERGESRFLAVFLATLPLSLLLPEGH